MRAAVNPREVNSGRWQGEEHFLKDETRWAQSSVPAPLLAHGILGARTCSFTGGEGDVRSLSLVGNCIRAS